MKKTGKIRGYVFWAVLTVTTVLMLRFLSGVTGEEDKTEQKAEVIAAKVEKKSEQTEKAEGKNDLVKDEVSVKTDTWGGFFVEQIGEASWYGKGFHGKKTASGEIFDQHDLTAAHPTLPMGTEATVTNLENGKSVDVTINDRGPYRHGRDIDLSKKAAEKIGMKKDGAVPVRIEAKVPPEDEKPEEDKKDTD
ncbi:MAG: septal ring lytic transglycosylase RlpA family protein [Desulfococcaceae bacterium]|jgi:rare lipoprotein A (peptidoglycan hydrolase)|nr:septal ring lytic transglycosylase RlpA family protein [Desulfococcaceae bacterium]